MACMGEKRSAYRVLLVNPEGERQRERHKRRCEKHIKMDLT